MFPQLPEPSALELLRQGLLLVYVWNKALAQPIIPVAGKSVQHFTSVILISCLKTSYEPPPQ